MTNKQIIDEWLGFEVSAKIALDRSDSPNVNAHMKCEPVAYVYDWSRLMLLYAYKLKPLFVVLARQQHGGGSHADGVSVSTVWRRLSHTDDVAHLIKTRIDTGRGLTRGSIPPKEELTAWLKDLHSPTKDSPGVSALFGVAVTYRYGVEHRLYSLHGLRSGPGWSARVYASAYSDTVSLDSAAANVLANKGTISPRSCAPEMLSQLCGMAEGATAQVPMHLTEPLVSGFVAAHRKRRASWGGGATESLRQITLVKIYKQSDEAKEWIDQKVVLRGLSKEPEGE